MEKQTLKIIFLDFDGVLNNAEFRANNKNYHENFIDETTMPYLRQIVQETGAKIVLSTTWKTRWDAEDQSVLEDTKKINDIFAKYDLEIYSKTDNFNDNRNFEISMWLCAHAVENYVILDDLDFHWSEENRRRFVKTNDNIGLDKHTSQLAINILNSTL